MNENFTYDMDELLVKYLLEEVSDDERRVVEQWVRSSDANKKQLEHVTLLWQESKKLESKTTADENQAWLRFSKRIHINEERAPVVSIEKRNPWMGRAVALLALVLGAAMVYFLINNKPVPQKELAKVQSLNSSLVQTLPDGSVVTLNKQSSIAYYKKFTDSAREVALTGEAFFNVTPDKLKPFIIKVNNVMVKVVGTSFNIKSANGRVEVIVETGVVEVMRKQKKIVLQAKEKTVVLDSVDVLVKENTGNQLYQHYRTKEFVCDNTPLWQLVEVLNETYSTNIIIESASLKNLPLSATFHQESLDVILDVISKTFGIKVVREKDIIILRK